MTDIVHRATHPDIIEIEARYLGELQEAQKEIKEIASDRDEWQEKAEEGMDCVDKERDFLHNVFIRKNPETGKEEETKISISELSRQLKDRKIHRWDGEYGVLSELQEVLNHLEPEIRYETEVKTVEKLPASIIINGKTYTQS